MRIGILYNVSDRARTGQDVEKSADAETPFTVRAIKAIFEKLHTIIPIKFSPEIYSYLTDGSIDILFNMCEGYRDDNLGEAYAAALLEQTKIPFTGSNFFTLSLCMDKARTKEILSYHQVPTPNFHVARSVENIPLDSLQLPIILKPLYEDASIGIYQDSVIQNREEVRAKVAQMLETYKQPILMEEFIDGRELNVSIVGNGDHLTVFPISEIEFNFPPSYHKIVCYEAKWMKDSLPFNNTPSVCPARLDKSVEEKVIDIAKKVFNLTGCRDYARVDLRLKKTENREEPTVIEVNPNPGKYVDSGFVRSALASGLTYEDLCYKLVETALERYGIEVNLLYREKRPQENNSAPVVKKDDWVAETARLFARRVGEKDLGFVLNWFNDREISRYMDNPDYLYTEQELYEMFLISRVHDLDLVFFDKESREPVAYGSLYDVDYRNRTGEISYLIGNRNYRGKGYGTELGKAMVAICFDQYDLESIFCSAVVENRASVSSILNNGFKQIGVRRKSHFLDGKFYDEMYFDRTRE